MILSLHLHYDPIKPSQHRLVIPQQQDVVASHIHQLPDQYQPPLPATFLSFHNLLHTRSNDGKFFFPEFFFLNLYLALGRPQFSLHIGYKDHSKGVNVSQKQQQSLLAKSKKLGGLITVEIKQRGTFWMWTYFSHTIE